MRVLLIGASGFIGSHVFQALVEADVEVIGFARKSSTKKTRNANSHQLLTLGEAEPFEDQLNKIFDEFKPEKVINAAAYYKRNDSINDIDENINSNFQLPLLLIKNCLMHGCDLINLSSFWQFDVLGHYDSRNIYSASKNSFEVLFDYFIKSKLLMGSSIIIYDTYGAYDNRDKLINSLLMLPKTNNIFRLHNRYGMMNLTHINDVVSGIINVLNQKKYRRYYELSNPEDMQVQYLIERIEDLLSVHFKIDYFEDLKNPQLKTARHKNLHPWPPNWQPRIPFEVGIIDLYKSQIENGGSQN